METIPRTLKAISFGFITLWACSLALAYAVSYVDQYQAKNIIGITTAGSTIFIGSIICGSLGIILCGAPAFILVSKYGHAKWRFVLLSSLFPSFLALFFDWKISVLLAFFALPIASTMRLFAGVSPNNTLKPLASLAGTGKAGPLA